MSYRSLLRTSTPASPVTLAEAKLAARIDTDDMDAHVQDLLAAAVEQAEHDTDRALCTTSYLLTLPNWVLALTEPAAPPFPPAVPDWPLEPFLELPRPPLVSVESVQYYDQAETLRTLDAASYSVDIAPRRGRICLASNTDWPSVARRWDAVQIAYTAGYGDPADVPAGLRVGIKKLVAYWFHNPAESDVPPAVARIFQSFAVHHRGY